VQSGTDERELVRKLVFTGHLSVPERKALAARVARANLIRSVVEEALRSGKPFHAWWLPDDSMIGCAIEFRGETPGRVWGSYRGIEGDSTGVREFDSFAEAAETLVRDAKPFWGASIDGVPIDWSA
jgi:hypothetical protein